MRKNVLENLKLILRYLYVMLAPDWPRKLSRSRDVSRNLANGEGSLQQICFSPEWEDLKGLKNLSRKLEKKLQFTGK